jgi:hypothetical protein
MTVCPTPTGFGIAPMYAAVDLADAAFVGKNDKGNVNAIIKATATIMFIFFSIFSFLRILARKFSKIFLVGIVYVSNLYIKSSSVFCLTKFILIQIPLLYTNNFSIRVGKKWKKTKNKSRLQ